MYDSVWWCTLLTTIVSFYCFGIFFYSIKKHFNGTYVDAYVCLLCFAFAAQDSYLWFARHMMYHNRDAFYLMLERIHYIPQTFFVLIILICLAVHKTIDILRKCKEGKEER